MNWIYSLQSLLPAIIRHEQHYFETLLLSHADL